AVWKLDFALPADIGATAVNGAAARWIRARLVGWRAPIPAIQAASLSAALVRNGLEPRVVLSGVRPLDLSMDFYPLGERPRFNDPVYIGSDEVFSRSGAVVTVTGTASTLQVRKDGDDPVLAWEVWTGSAWQKLDTTAVAVGAGADPLWTVRFTLP